MSRTVLSRGKSDSYTVSFRFCNGEDVSGQVQQQRYLGFKVLFFKSFWL